MTHTAPRRGFTLVELLVAIALAIVVLGLALYVANSATFESYKVVGAGDRLSQWLVTAKNRALRDKSPRGVRLQVNGNFVTECAYIEQPDTWAPSDPGSFFQLLYPTNGSGQYTTASQEPSVTQSPPSPVAFQPPGLAFLTIGPNDLNSFAALNLTNGDMVYISPLSTTLRITIPAGQPSTSTVVGVAVAAGSQLAALMPGNPTFNNTASGVPSGANVQLSVTILPDFGATGSSSSSMPNTASYQTTGFGIIRQPQLLLGEPTLQLASGMAIDVAQQASGSGPSYPFSNSLNVNSLPPNSGGTSPAFFDILFAPSGEVIGSPTGLIALLLRDTNKDSSVRDVRVQSDYDAAGEMILVCIYQRTGTVATQQVAPPSTGDPFKFAKDGINSGL